MNKKEATQKMINQELNAIPLTLIERAYPDIDGWERLTPLKIGDYVIYNGEGAEVIEYIGDDVYTIEDTYGETETVESWEIEMEDAPLFPMWGTVWQAVDPVLNRFIGDNMEKVAECGFEIYEAEDVDGYILGINGAGYDFYEAHWIPLYEAQGLKWHDE